MNILLGKELESYIAEQIAKGSYADASEVVRDALRLHEECGRKLETLRSELQKGLQSLKDGQVSHAKPEDIFAKAQARKHV